MTSSLRIWIQAIRPKTLTAALIPICVGTSLSYTDQGEIRSVLMALALASVLFIQIGTNLINDAVDFRKGADTAERLGPTRVTQSGLLTARQVFRGGLQCFILAALFALPLVYVGGMPILVIGLFSLLAGYAYTAGPFPLAYLGLGDLFVLIFFGWVAVSGIYYLNTGSWSLNAWVAGSQIGLLSTSLIAINNLRDHLTDRKVNKRTMAVRLGPTLARLEIITCCLIPYFGALYWIDQSFYAAATLPFLSLPLAIRLSYKVGVTEPGAIYNRFLAQAAGHSLFFSILLSIGFLLQ
jgi:1,4-dihydroxy-2-naphthoate octaprenyltransferase